MTYSTNKLSSEDNYTDTSWKYFSILFLFLKYDIDNGDIFALFYSILVFLFSTTTTFHYEIS